MKKLPPVATMIALLMSMPICAQEQDPFGGPALDPFGAPAKSEREASSKKKSQPNRTKPATVAKATLPIAQYPYVAVGIASESKSRIERALLTETSFDYLDQPLQDVIEDISYSHNIPIVIESWALEDFGIATSTPVTYRIKGISLRSALNLMLTELQLTFCVRDEVLQITTLEVRKTRLSTRFYPVSELLPNTKDGELLVELLTTMILPDSWSSVGGPASIIYLPHLESLAISQTDDAFHEIGNLLAATKKLADMKKESDERTKRVN